MTVKPALTSRESAYHDRHAKAPYCNPGRACGTFGVVRWKHIPTLSSSDESDKFDLSDNYIYPFPFQLRRWVARVAGYLFVPFDSVLCDRENEPARRVAWLRDQYQHPEEHRHTLAEVQR
jgi:hypothetical protein